MQSELLPCPFCGSGRVTVWNIRDGQQAVCKECKSTGAPTFHGPDGPKATWVHAVEAWNRRAALSAALSEQTQPVRVKALEWSLIYSSDDETAWSAMAIGGVYTVRQLTNTGGAWLHCVRTEKRYPSVDAAKAAVQQEYETRIRSALVDVPAEPVAEAGEMPGSNGGFTMAAFRASDVPIGTKLYTTPPSTRTASSADGSASKTKGASE